MTVDADNRPVVLIAVCRLDISRVDLYGEKNPDVHAVAVPIGVWTTSPKTSGVLQLNLSEPVGWTVTKAPNLVGGQLYGVIPQASQGQHEARQVDFTLAQLGHLGPDDVLTGAGVSTRAHFAAHSCDDLHR